MVPPYFLEAPTFIGAFGSWGAGRRSGSRGGWCAPFGVFSSKESVDVTVSLAAFSPVHWGICIHMRVCVYMHTHM